MDNNLHLKYFGVSATFRLSDPGSMRIVVGKAKPQFSPASMDCEHSKGTGTSSPFNGCSQHNRCMMTATIFTAKEAADYLKISYEHLGALRRKAAGPPFFNLGWSVRYRKAELDEWIEKRLVRAA